MYCTTCGIRLRPEHQFCSKCGTKLELSNESTFESIKTTNRSIEIAKKPIESLPEIVKSGIPNNKAVSFLANNKKKIIIMLSAITLFLSVVLVIRDRIEHSPKTFLHRTEVIMNKFESGVQRQINDLQSTDFSTLRTDGQIDLSDAGMKYEFLGYKFSETSRELTLLSWHNKIPKTQELEDFFNGLRKVIDDYSEANMNLKAGIKDGIDTTSIIEEMAIDHG